MYVYDLIQIAEFLVWILQREGMECREERFAYLLTLSVVQHTNVQSNCPVLWDQKITKLPIELQGNIW